MILMSDDNNNLVACTLHAVDPCTDTCDVIVIVSMSTAKASSRNSTFTKHTHAHTMNIFSHCSRRAITRSITTRFTSSAPPPLSASFRQTGSGRLGRMGGTADAFSSKSNAGFFFAEAQGNANYSSSSSSSGSSGSCKNETSAHHNNNTSNSSCSIKMMTRLNPCLATMADLAFLLTLGTDDDDC